MWKRKKPRHTYLSSMNFDGVVQLQTILYNKNKDWLLFLPVSVKNKCDAQKREKKKRKYDFY